MINDIIFAYKYSFLTRMLCSAYIVNFCQFIQFQLKLFTCSNSVHIMLFDFYVHILFRFCIKIQFQSNVLIYTLIQLLYKLKINRCIKKRTYWISLCKSLYNIQNPTLMSNIWSNLSPKCQLNNSTFVSTFYMQFLHI